MADNTQLSENIGTGDVLATAEVTFSGDTVKAEIVGVGFITGTAESYVLNLASVGAGAVGNTVQRMTLASDDPAVVALQLIDNTVAVLGTGTYTEAVTSGNIIGAVRNDDLSTLVDTNNEIAPLQVDDKGGLHISLKSIEDANNTTDSTLGGGATFTGASTDTLHFKTITIIIFADQNSAADGVVLQWSGDGTNWNHTAEYTYTANADFSIGASVRGRFFRVLYTNGGAAQGTFRMFTFMHPTQAAHNIRPLEYVLDAANSAAVTRSVISAKNAGGTYVNITATNAGNLKMSVQEISDGLDVGAGNAGSETQRVSIATDDVNLSAIKTAMELLDNTVAVLGTATYSEATTSGNVMGAVRNDDLATLANTDNEIAPLQVDPQGALYVNAAAAEPKQASGVAVGGAPGTDDMIAAVAGKKILVLAVSLFATSTTTNTVYIDNVDNDLLGNSGNGIVMSLDADGDTVAGFVLPYNPGGWFKTDTVNEAVTLNTSAAQDIIYCITYIETD